jgi:hypothetical protein
MCQRCYAASRPQDQQDTTRVIGAHELPESYPEGRHETCSLGGGVCRCCLPEWTGPGDLLRIVVDDGDFRVALSEMEQL